MLTLIRNIPSFTISQKFYSKLRYKSFHKMGPTYKLLLFLKPFNLRQTMSTSFFVFLLSMFCSC